MSRFVCSVLLLCFPVSFSDDVQGGSYGPKWCTNDVIGLGYYPFKKEIFFTKNGVYLGVAFTDVPPLEYHIAIGMHSTDECVQLNTGQKPFMYKEISAKHIRRPDLHWAGGGCGSNGGANPNSGGATELLRPRVGFEIKEDLLTVKWTSDECGCLLSNGSLIAGARPAPIHSDSIGYYEIELDHDTSVCIPVTVCVGFASNMYDLDRQPGWESISYGLHGDNASLYHNDGSSIRHLQSCTLFKAGDIIGCGLDRKKHEIFYTQNGKHLGIAFAHIATAAATTANNNTNNSNMDYYATVGLYDPMGKVIFNFGATPFKYEPMNGAAGASASSSSSSSSSSSNSSLLSSPRHNTLGRHADCVQIDSSNQLTAYQSYSEPTIGIVQSTLPIMTRRKLDPLLDDEMDENGTGTGPGGVDSKATGEVFTPLPFHYFYDCVCTSFGPHEDEALVTLLNIRAAKLHGSDDFNTNRTLLAAGGADINASPLSIEPAEFEITQEEKLTHAVLNTIVETCATHPYAIMTTSTTNAAAASSATTDNIAHDMHSPVKSPTAAMLHSNLLTPSLSSSGSPSSPYPASSPSNAPHWCAPCLNPYTSAFQFKLRVAFLQTLNQLLARAIVIVNLSKIASGSSSAAITAQTYHATGTSTSTNHAAAAAAKRSIFSRHYRDAHIRALFFYGIKKYLLRSILIQTTAPLIDNPRAPSGGGAPTPFLLHLDLFKSQKLTHQGRSDSLSYDKSLFGQLFQQLYLHRHEQVNKYGDPDQDPLRFFIKYRGRAWKTIYKGMYADDYGGVYRDTLDRICQELINPAHLLNLFILCPNAREQIGENRNHWVPNPSATSPIQLQAYEFIGRPDGTSFTYG